MSKCNFVNHDLCRGGWVNASLEKMCIAVEQPCPHKALTPAEIAATPSPVKLVVEYWRHPNSADFCKTINGLIAETVGNWGNTVGEQLKCLECLKTPVSESEYLAAKKAEEAARKPAVDVRDARRRHLDALADEPAIEPLSGSKYNEALAWLNGERSLSNVVPQDPYETWQERIARADAAMTEQAYWVVRAYNERKRVNALEGGGGK